MKKTAFYFISLIDSRMLIPASFESDSICNREHLYKIMFGNEQHSATVNRLILF